MLEDGKIFAARILDLLHEGDAPQLAHIATDGETYGHHHRFGEMALAYALESIDQEPGVALTNYGEFLEKYPPEYEVQINENTSWSCSHGVERWRSNCGCRGDGAPEWDQEWRGPLRGALDFLRDRLSELFLEKGAELLKDPAAAKEDFIEIVLDRSRENVQAWFDRHAARDLSEDERIAALKLMEMQRHAMLMYTSCGWFFTELSGIETVQVIQYAARALQLAEEIFGPSLEAPFLERLAEAKSNIPAHKDGREIYEKFAKPAIVDLVRVGAHYAVSSLFDSDGAPERVYCFDVESEDYRAMEAGKTRLAVGKARISSRITHESKTVAHGFFHMGDHNLAGGVRDFRARDGYEQLVGEVTEAFKQADVPQLLQLFEKNFGGSTYSLRSLFRDEQRKISDALIRERMSTAEVLFGNFYDESLGLMRFFAGINIPPPRVFNSVAESVINLRFRSVLSELPIDSVAVDALLDEAQLFGVKLPDEELSYLLQKSLEGHMRDLEESPDQIELLDHLIEAGKLRCKLPFQVDLWRVQNAYVSLLKRRRESAAEGKEEDPEAAQADEKFRTLGTVLNVAVEQIS